MLYSNPEFFYFFLLVLGAYLLLGFSYRAKFFLLTAASLFFYSWAGLFDSVIFFFVVLVSWLSVWLAHRFPAERSRRAFLVGGIVVMSVHLLFWKYGPWLTGLVQARYPHFLGGKKLELPLPVGISFFTLQGIAYLVDYGRDRAKYLDFKSFLLFKSFFPQLVAGPIVRSHQLAPQLERLPRPSALDLREGLSLFAWGFLKKVAIADRMAAIADPVFATPENYTARSMLLALLAYTAQIWGDFSGYTDMGRGAARMLGIQLPENFFSPYFSRSPSEFWRRWHVTLSQWIRDYIYIPLGGGQGSALRVAAVAMITMILSGLWHGAAFTFLFWGVYHGLLLTLERFSAHWGFPLFRSRWAVLWMFGFTVFGWLLFRAESLDKFLYMAGAIFHLKGAGAQQISLWWPIFGLGGCLALQGYFYPLLPSLQRPVQAWSAQLFPAFRRPSPWVMGSTGVAVAFLFCLALLLRQGDNSAKFIYFQF